MHTSNDYRSSSLQYLTDMAYVSRVLIVVNKNYYHLQKIF